MENTGISSTNYKYQNTNPDHIKSELRMQIYGQSRKWLSQRLVKKCWSAKLVGLRQLVKRASINTSRTKSQEILTNDHSVRVSSLILRGLLQKLILRID